MKIKIGAIKKKDMPSKFGTGTWSIYQIKGEGSETIYELKGYSPKYLENLKAGDEIVGVLNERSWQGKDGKVGSSTELVKITVEYLYDLITSTPPVNSEPTPGEASGEDW